MSDAPASLLPATPLCDLLDCRHPLILAGMGGVARSELVAAVSEAGGFGFLGMVREPVALIQSEVQRVRERTGRRFGVNLIPAATEARLLRRQVDLCIELGVPVVCLFWDVAHQVIERLRKAGVIVVHQVGSAAEALLAQEAGAHALIAQGVEAGGHVRGRQPLDALLADVLPVVHIPVAAAGGIADGRRVAQLLARGAQAAVLGTALLATRESFANDYHKRHIVSAEAGDTVLTEAFHINWPPHAAVRVLQSSVTRGERGSPQAAGRTQIGDEEGRPIYLFSTDSPLRSMTGDFESMALYAGQGVDRITAIEPAADCIARLVAEAEAAWPPARAAAAAGPVELSSPVCYAAEFERERNAPLIARLNELLEAERAGVRVTVQTLAQIEASRAPALHGLVEAIHHDEAQWCVLLVHAIRDLGCKPGTRTGDFHARAMAIPDLHERLLFLNRGQGWVAKKLRELLPLVEEDPALHRGLTRMLHSHEQNLDKVNQALETPAASR
ncbi:MAG: nitronate monooxygenase [Comamonas sp.]